MGKPRKKKSTRLLCIENLSFTSHQRKATWNFWSVEPTGDYEDDTFIGETLAIELLRFEMTQKDDSGYPLLGWIVLSIINEAANKTPEHSNGVRVVFSMCLDSYYGTAQKAPTSTRLKFI